MTRLGLERQFVHLSGSSPARPLLEALAQDMRRTDTGIYHKKTRAVWRTAEKIQYRTHCNPLSHCHPYHLQPSVQLVEIQSCSYLDSSP